MTDLWLQVAGAIKAMVVRGAPAIGITAAYGLAMADKAGCDTGLARDQLAASRPTAVNLQWALDRILSSPDMEEAALALHQEDLQLNTRLGLAGAELLSGAGLDILTCSEGKFVSTDHFRENFNLSKGSASPAISANQNRE